MLWQNYMILWRVYYKYIDDGDVNEYLHWINCISCLIRIFWQKIFNLLSLFKVYVSSSGKLKVTDVFDFCIMIKIY